MPAPSSSSCATRISPPLHARIRLPSPTQLDTEIFEQIRLLFRKNWRKGAQVRLLGVQASSFEAQAGQGDLLEDGRRQRWQQALSAADRLRDKFGESSVSLASGLRGGFRERTHENPAGLPGKGKGKTLNPKVAKQTAHRLRGWFCISAARSSRISCDLCGRLLTSSARRAGRPSSKI